MWLQVSGVAWQRLNMAISFVAAGTVVTGANPTVTVPSGTTAGDFLLMYVAAGIASVTSPTGWTSLASTTGGGPTNLFYKIAGASEPSAVIVTVNTSAVSGMVGYRGTSSGFDVKQVSINTGTATSLATTSITTTQANDYVISYYACAVTANTWTAPASTTTRTTTNATASFRGVLIVDELQASAGASTARTATLANSVGISAYAIALKEASTPKGSFFFLM